METQTSSSSVSFDSQIQIDQQPICHSNTSYDRTTNANPNEKGSSNRSTGSTPKLIQLGFPPVSNTNDNFDVQVNWTKSILVYALTFFLGGEKKCNHFILDFPFVQLHHKVVYVFVDANYILLDEDMIS